MTAITPYDDRAAIVSPVGIPGADQLDGQHLSMPRVKLVQPTSQTDGGNPGEWWNSLLGTAAATLRVVPLRIQFGRVWFPKPGEAGAGEVKCASDDSIRARPANVEFPSRLCADCPLSQWTDDQRTGRRIPPPCAFTYSYVLFDVDTEMPIQITLSKTAVPAARQLNTMIKAFGVSRMLIIRSKEVRGDAGKYYVPIIADGGSVGPDNAAYYGQLAQGMAMIALATEDEAGTPPPAAQPQRPQPPREVPVQPVAAAPAPAATTGESAAKKALVSEVRRLANECVQLGASNSLLDPDYAAMGVGQLQDRKSKLERLKQQLQATADADDDLWTYER